MCTRLHAKAIDLVTALLSTAGRSIISLSLMAWLTSLLDEGSWLLIRLPRLLTADVTVEARSLPDAPGCTVCVRPSLPKPTILPELADCACIEYEEKDSAVGGVGPDALLPKPWMRPCADKDMSHELRFTAHILLMI